MDEVPVQFFQSVIAIQLAVTGALLFNIRFFDTRPQADATRDSARNPWLLLLVSLILMATLLGCLYAIRHGGQARAASAVTVGLALSIIPILLRVLPPLGRHPDSSLRHPHAIVTIIGLACYFAAVTAIVIALHR
jgi:hypothetical protein